MSKLAISAAWKVHLLREKIPLLSGLNLFVYRNDYTPTDATTLGDLVVEPDVRIYQSPFRALPPIVWGVPHSRDDGDAEVSSENIVVQLRLPSVLASIYGWFALDDTAGLAFSQRFTGIVPKLLVPLSEKYNFRIDFREASIP